LNDILRSIAQWALANLDYIVAASFISSLGSLVFSAIQVRRKKKAMTLVSASPEQQVPAGQAVVSPSAAEMQQIPAQAVPLALHVGDRLRIIDAITLAALSGIQVTALLKPKREPLVRKTVPTQAFGQQIYGQGQEQESAEAATGSGQLKGSYGTSSYSPS